MVLCDTDMNAQLYQSHLVHVEQLDAYFVLNVSALAKIN